MRRGVNEYYAKGDVRLYQADVLQFLKALPDDSVDLIVTDPAYSGMNNMLKLGKGRIVGNYQKDINHKWFDEFKDDPDNFRQFLDECYRVMKRDRHIYIMFDSYSLISLSPIVREVFDVKNIIVWDKVNIGMGHYHRRRHELILFASKGKRKLNARNIPDVWCVKRITRPQYPTQKPVELFDYMLAGSTEPGYVVCDPFLGSGSSMVSALKYGNSFIGNDISEKALDIAAKRAGAYMHKGVDIFDDKGTKLAKEDCLPEQSVLLSEPLWQS